MKKIFRLEIDNDNLDPAQVELFLQHALDLSCKLEKTSGDNKAIANMPQSTSAETDQIKEQLYSYKLVTEQSSDIITFIDEEGNFVYVNPAFCKQTGYSEEEALEMNVCDIDINLTQEKIKEMAAMHDNTDSLRFESAFRRKNNELVNVEVVGTKFIYNGKRYIASNLRDITGRKLAEQSVLASEAQLRQSQKMEAIGKLSGGVAHDFNNLLSVIMLHVDMLKLQIAPESPLRYRVEEIKSASAKAAALTRQLLAFSRRQILQPREVSLNLIVVEIAKLLRRLIGEDIELRLDLASDLDIIMVDPDQMSQVLMNLALNSRDAMPEGGGLSIQTANVRFDKKSPMSPNQPFGNYVQLIVSDAGCGMEEGVLERIFDPFFTTKEAGKGTGLGLSTVYGIIKQSGGYITVESEVGVGTTFTIQLPRAEDQQKDAGLEEKDRTMIVGSETILLVEDEELIRKAANEVLVVLGYTVLQAKDGFEALELVKGYDKEIDLLLTDVVMPKMNGSELAQCFSLLRPDTPVLYMSGYTDDIVVRYGVLRDGTPFIEKPFTPSSLGNKVREVLEAKTTQQK